MYLLEGTKVAYFRTSSTILCDINALLSVTYNYYKSPWPEGWPLFCLRECAEELSISLSILFNKSLESSVLPHRWKEVLVTPVFKKGDRTQVIPIDPICKIMESIIKNNLQEYLEANNIIPCTTTAWIYCRKISCSTQLLLAMNDWPGQMHYRCWPLRWYFVLWPSTLSYTTVWFLSFVVVAYLEIFLSGFLVERKQKVVLNN